MLADITINCRPVLAVGMLTDCETKILHTGLSDVARANVLGVGVHAVNIFRAVNAIDWAIRRRQKGYVCVTGVHGVMEAQRDSRFRAILNNAYLVVPDGMPTVWVGKLQGHTEIDRVFGPELMLAFCELSQSRGYRHFLYGGDHGVAERLKNVLQARFHKLDIVGTYTPPFRDLKPDEQAHLVLSTAKLKPEVIWVGLSTPKQERFMAENLYKLDTTIMVGVGAAFDLHTGRIKDSPEWVKRAGMQWIHRLAQEPKRLWKRYLLNNPKFVFEVARQFLGLRRFPTVPSVTSNSDQQLHH